MTLLPPLETLIPEDHYLRRLNRVLDLHFVHDVVRERYCQDNGRPSIDPEVIIRLFLLQAMDGIVHVRELMRQVQVNLAYRWFIGYRLDEALPDHSTLSRALDRFGDQVFNELFERSIAQCQASGVIEGRVLHVDATTIRADIDRNRVGEPDSSDPDARYGKFPGKNTAPGYKQQTVVDDQSRVVLDVTVMPANCPDDTFLSPVLDRATVRLSQTPSAVCADAAYGSGRNRAALEERGIRLVSPPQKPKTYTGTRYFTTEDFTYDESRDEFTCPAGVTLRCVGTPKSRPDRRIYRAPGSACRQCALKPQCTRGSRRQLKVSQYHAAMVRLRADSKTESFKTLYRRRAPVVEGIFAEAKQWHGLRRAWRRGLGKVRAQCLVVAAILNFKRLAALFLFSRRFAGVFSAFGELISTSLGASIRHLTKEEELPHPAANQTGKPGFLNKPQMAGHPT
jgi:transposase